MASSDCCIFRGKFDMAGKVSSPVEHTNSRKQLEQDVKPSCNGVRSPGSAGCAAARTNQVRPLILERKFQRKLDQPGSLRLQNLVVGL